MGEEIRQSDFSPHDFSEFQRRLNAETELFKHYLEDQVFSYPEPKVGYELEAWLVDSRKLPAPVNDAFLQKLNNPCVVHELSQFNVELNTSPFVLGGDAFSQLFVESNRLWDLCQRAARPLDAQMAMIGILPTLRPDMLTLDHMSKSKRYKALNEQIFRHRHGRPVRLDIQGPERLQLTHSNVMLEASTTSLQIHLDLPPKHEVNFYNAALLLSPAMVALAANSPFVYGKRLWEESRIPLFEQAVPLDEFIDSYGFSVGRVSFGSGYLKKSIFEIFLENLNHFSPLLPICYGSSPEEFHHLRLHNGTVWRWNRPLVGLDLKGNPSLRLEHRVAAAGPTVRDVVANVAFFTGAVEYYSRQKNLAEILPDFPRLREGFYRAARYGLDAKVFWTRNREVSIKELLLAELIPHSVQGLKYLEINKEDIQNCIGETVLPRVQTGQTGARWQGACLEKTGGNFLELTERYLENQNAGQPVHRWP